MRILLLLPVACLTASAAPLPPMPVVRPKPLETPRAAAIPRVTPMFKPASVPATLPLTQPAPPMSVTITTNINFLGCDVLEPGCVMFFNQNIRVDHPAGAELTIYMKDEVNAPAGGKIAWFGAAPYARVSEFTWYQEMFKFPVARFFYDMKVYPIVPTTATRSTAAPAIWVAPNLKYASAKSVKKP